MLIVFHGEDTFRSKIKLKELIDAYTEKHKGGFSFERVNALYIAFAELKNALESLSLFDSNKLVVLENLLDNKQLKEDLASWENLEAFAGEKNNLLIVFEDKLADKDKEYKNILSRASKKQAFQALSASEAAKWLRTYFEKQGKKIDAGILRAIVSASAINVPRKGPQANMWQAYNDANKLYAYNKAKRFTQKEALLLHIGSEEAQIFPTIDAIFNGQLDKAFYNIQVHWQDDYAPQQFFAMLERQVRLIALAKEQKENNVSQSAAAKDLGLHPFVVKKTYALCDRFSWPKIENLYNRLESLDIRSKTGQIDPRLACELISVAVAS